MMSLKAPFPYFGGNQVAPHDIEILMYRND